MIKVPVFLLWSYLRHLSLPSFSSHLYAIQAAYLSRWLKPYSTGARGTLTSELGVKLLLVAAEKQFPRKWWSSPFKCCPKRIKWFFILMLHLLEHHPGSSRIRFIRKGVSNHKTNYDLHSSCTQNLTIRHVPSLQGWGSYGWMTGKHILCFHLHVQISLLAES